MKVLAVSSGGGHWIELQRVMPAFASNEVHYITVNDGYHPPQGANGFHVVTDATRSNPLLLVKMLLELTWIIARIKPDIVVSTGAAPGLVSLLVAKIAGAKTIWLDSIANVDELSGSGRYAKWFADLWLTQWEHLAGEGGPDYAGKVL